MNEQKSPEKSTEKQAINRLTYIFTVVVAVLLAVVITFMATYVTLNVKWQMKINDIYSDLKGLYKLRQLTELYEKNYVYDFDDEQLYDYLASAYITYAGDRFGHYWSAADYYEYLNDRVGNLVGVGIFVNYSEDIIRIQAVMDNTPASEAGLQVDDVILSVDGKTPEADGYAEVYGAVAGIEGTSVAIEIKRGEELLHFDIVRRSFEGKVVFSTLTEDKIAIIKITDFATSAYEQFKTELGNVLSAGCEKIVFDMRSNPGGDLATIVNILDMLLPEGPIVRIMDADGNEVKRYTSNAASVDLPMAVLCNEITASAAELFTAALRDYGMSYTVGETTYGKGTMQRSYTLSDGAIMNISVNLYNPPFSENYDGKGIVPDLTVDSGESYVNYFAFDEATDAQLRAAMEYLRNK